MPRASPKHSRDVYLHRHVSSLGTRDYMGSGRDDPDKTAEFIRQKPDIFLKSAFATHPMVIYWRRFAI
jgi:hypothetical protein